MTKHRRHAGVFSAQRSSRDEKVSIWRDVRPGTWAEKTDSWMRKREGAKETGAEGKRYKRGKKRTEVNERDRFPLKNTMPFTHASCSCPWLSAGLRLSYDGQYQLVTSPWLGIFLLSLDTHEALVSVEYPQMGERHPLSNHVSQHYRPDYLTTLTKVLPRSTWPVFLWQEWLWMKPLYI